MALESPSYTLICEADFVPCRGIGDFEVFWPIEKLCVGMRKLMNYADGEILDEGTNSEHKFIACIAEARERDGSVIRDYVHASPARMFFVRHLFGGGTIAVNLASGQGTL